MAESAEEAADEGWLTGDGDRDRPAEAAEAAQGVLENQVARARAEGIVNDARGLALLAEQDVAAQLLSAARATAWAAAQAGDRAGMDAARERVIAVQATFARVTAEAVQEVNGIPETQRERVAELIVQFRRAWVAMDADPDTRRPG